MQWPQIFRQITFIVVVILFIGLGFWGFRYGRSYAQARDINKNVLSMQQALAYFLADQQRYPTKTEFANINAMQPYVDNLPWPTYVNHVCPSQWWDYQNPFGDEYTLRFCLPVGAGAYGAGWSQVVSPKK